MPLVIDFNPTPLNVSTEIVLDPEELGAGRVELHLHRGPIMVTPEGIDWGDAAVEQYLAGAERGSLPVDYRVPNRTIVIPLLLGASGRDGFAEARAALQAKVALIQRESRGWLRRGPYYCDIVNATLHMPDRFGHLGFEADVILTLEALPDFYGAEETLADATGTGELVISSPDVRGDYPARCRIVVANNATSLQRGLVWGARSRNADPASTAALSYPAQNLTKLGATHDTTFAGVPVIRNFALASWWTPVAHTDTATGPLTHVGTYRVWARACNASSGTAQLRFVWSTGDSVLTTDNDPVEIPATGALQLVDLGAVHLSPPPTGAHRWRGQLQAVHTAPAGTVIVAQLLLVPADDGYGVISAGDISSVPVTGYTVHDEFAQTSGLLAGKTLAAGGAWATSGSAGDFAVNPNIHKAQRSAINATAASAGRFALAGTGSFTDVVLRGEFSRGPINLVDPGKLQYQGLIVRYVDATNWLIVAVSTEPIAGAGAYAIHIVSNLGGVVSTVPVTTGRWYPGLQVEVDSDGVIQVKPYQTGSEPGEPVYVAVRSDLATGGALASGRVGIYDVWTGSETCTRTYDNFAAWVPQREAVAHPGRSCELRSDGVWRQSPDGTGQAEVVPRGDLPRLAPSGLEGRTVEVFLRPTRGDLDTLPDLARDALSVSLTYQPSWLFPPVT
jgi:hypothetical protein